MHPFAIIAVVVFALAAAAPLRASGTSPPPVEPLQFSACQVGPTRTEARCGAFAVPEDRAKPEGRRLPLKVVILASLTPGPAEPVFLLLGGPGQAATDAAGDPALAWMRKGHDVVMMDFRGTGEGSRLDCAPAATDAQYFLTPLFGEPQSFWRDCAVRLSRTADLELYTTPIALEDLDELRQRLGAGQIDIVGSSYGTRAAIAYIHAHPERVRAAVLSGVVPLDDRNPLHHATAAQRAFDLTVAECAHEPACHTAFPDAAGDLRTVLATLRASPARVTLNDPASAAKTSVRLDAAAFAEGVRVMLYSMDSARRLPLLLNRARYGDYGPFAEAALGNGRGVRDSLRLGLLLSDSCPEDVARIDANEIPAATAGTFLGDQRVRGQMAACAVWPTGRLPNAYYAPFSSDVPVLFVSGAHDPVTPPQWGEDAMKSFPHGAHLITNGAHADINSCVERLAAALFRSGSIKQLEARCAEEGDLPPFVLH